MFFPISDDDREVTTTAYVTYSLMAINLALFLLQLSDPAFTYGWSVIPLEITTGVDLVEPISIQIEGYGNVDIPQAPGPPILWLTLLTSMFMHGGLFGVVPVQSSQRGLSLHSDCGSSHRGTRDVDCDAICQQRRFHRGHQ